MLAATPHDDSELCPSCGEWANLTELGWCAKCTLATKPHLNTCSTCGGFYPRKAHQTTCWPCRREEYLFEHADKIEELMMIGYGFTKALELLAASLRPLCASCKQPIKGGKPDRKFCAKPKCRTQSKQYSSLRRKGLSPEVALAIATGKVAIYDSIN